MLSTGLEKCEDVPILSAGLTDVWAGIHGHQPVIIEAFRDYPPQLLEELKEVRIPSRDRPLQGLDVFYRFCSDGYPSS